VGLQHLAAEEVVSFAGMVCDEPRGSNRDLRVMQFCLTIV
jgi:hypothetical protein